jgi:zinc protease
MSRLFRRALMSGVGFSLAVATGALAAPPPAKHRAPPPAASAQKRDGVWAQTYSDLPADANVRFGTLANGMRYAILRNATPPGQASIRLRIGSGSLEESDAQQGLAHFLEHMAFKGSKKVPEGDMIKILERKGLAFGPDTNAFTSFDQTVFMLDLPETDADTLSTGMMLMRETASELTLSQTAMDPERGVVLSEERLRSTPAYRAGKQQLQFLLKGQRVPDRYPIGDVKVLQTAPVSQIRDYYETNYRPDRATLVVVGDIDPADIEKRIKAGFSNWKPAKAGPHEPDLGKVVVRGAQTNLVVESGAPMAIGITWTKPSDNSADTAATRRRDFIDEIGVAVLNRRLERLARGDKPPFIAAGASSGDFLRTAKLSSLEVQSQPDEWRPALAATVTEERRLVQFGARQDEVDREVAELRAKLQTEVAGAGTRRTPALANAIAGVAGSDDVFTTPAEDLALFDAEVKSMTLAEVNAALHETFQGNGPLLTVTSPKPIEGGDKAVNDEFARALAAPVTASAVAEAKTWPYTNFGTPSAVVERRALDDLGTTFVRFANGVRLTVKPTDFRKDQILVNVEVGDGRLDLPKDHPTEAWANNALIQGGLEDLSIDQIEQVFASNILSTSVAVGDTAFNLEGRTRPQDFDLQMQALAAYVTHPGWRPEGFQRLKSSYLSALDQIDATPGGVLGRNIQAQLHSEDPRWETIPSRPRIEAARLEDLKALLSGPLSTGPIEVVVVGDTTVDKAIAATAATFGALPPRPSDQTPPAGALKVKFPAPTATPLVLTHKGRADQAMGLVAWPAVDAISDPHAARVVNLAEKIFQNRLIDQVRIAEGATYSPQAQAGASDTFPGYGFVLALVETPPAKLGTFFDDVSKITGDMASKGVTADELERARKPVLETLQKNRQTNEWWLRALARTQTQPGRVAQIRDDAADLQKVTTAEVQKATAAYLTDPRAWKLTILPQAAAAAPPAAH